MLKGCWGERLGGLCFKDERERKNEKMSQGKENWRLLTETRRKVSTQVRWEGRKTTENALDVRKMEKRGMKSR